MARKELKYTVVDEGRDKGKTFLITEMSADRAERWAVRVFLLLARNGFAVPDGAASGGLVALAGLLTNALHHLGAIPFEDIEPLLGEMFACVQIIPDVKRSEVVRYLVEDDIEEIATRLKLRGEIIKLHVGFSLGGK